MSGVPGADSSRIVLGRDKGPSPLTLCVSIEVMLCVFPDQVQGPADGCRGSLGLA